MVDPLLDAPMSDKQTDDYINTFFTSLTKEYLKVKDEWLSVGNEDLYHKLRVKVLQ